MRQTGRAQCRQVRPTHSDTKRRRIEQNEVGYTATVRKSISAVGVQARKLHTVGRNGLVLAATGQSLAAQAGQELELSLRWRPAVLCPSHGDFLLQRYLSCALCIWSCRVHGKVLLHVFIDHLQSPHRLLISAQLDDRITGKNHAYHYCNNLKSQVIVLAFLCTSGSESFGWVTDNVTVTVLHPHENVSLQSLILTCMKSSKQQ